MHIGYKTKVKLIVYLLSSCVLLLNLACKSTTNPVNPIHSTQSDIEYISPYPTEQQLKFQENEITMFIRFGIPTFSESYPGSGFQPATDFNPTSINVQQWIDVAKKNGIKRIILSTKTIEGFCLWPSQLTNYSVKYSPFENGKSDIVKSLSYACKLNGIDFGIAQSPVDFHSPYFGRDLYNDFFINQLNELLTLYGNISDIYLEDPTLSGRTFTQIFDWNRYYTYIRLAQPYSLVLGMGPDATVNQGLSSINNDFNSSVQMSDLHRHGFTGVKVWDPKIVSISVSDKWFSSINGSSIVKTSEELFSIYLATVGKNCNLLLSVAPNVSGEIDASTIESLNKFTELKERFFNGCKVFPSNATGEFRNGDISYSPTNLIDNNENSFWTTNSNIKNASIIFSFHQLETINCIRLNEAIKYGERVSSFLLYYLNNSGQWQLFYSGTGIGNNSLIAFNSISTNSIKLYVSSQVGSPAISNVEFYNKVF